MIVLPVRRVSTVFCQSFPVKIMDSVIKIAGDVPIALQGLVEITVVFPCAIVWDRLLASPPMHLGRLANAIKIGLE